MNQGFQLVEQARLELLLIKERHQQIKEQYRGEHIPRHVMLQMTEELKVFRLQCDKEIRRFLRY